jgi:serine/threonine-protein kinase
VGTFNFIGAIVTAAIVALRNVRRGRGDRRGALRFALFMGAMRMAWFLGAHHVASPEEADVLIDHLSFAMLRVGVAYVFYLALEPYARRLWPRMLVTWVRVLEGRFRDPQVGRDLLIGCAAGALITLSGRLAIWIPGAFGGVWSLPLWHAWGLETLRGPFAAFTAIIGIQTTTGLFSIIFPLTLLLVFRLVLRRTGPAAIAVSLLGVLMFFPETGSIPGYIVGFCLSTALFWFVLFRFGLLAFAAIFGVHWLLDQLPLTLQPPGWYLGSMLLARGLVAAPALWGFWTSQAGRPLFRDEILEPAPRR